MKENVTIITNAGVDWDKYCSSGSSLPSLSSASIKPSIGANFGSNLIVEIDSLFQLIWTFS